uniref:Uncharacterized protein n=1 Tax=viral metagenome TaxID=1070528 RepID=A0A6C0D925_9ZZZZ
MFQNKYLKYKKKYLELKNYKGGSSDSELQIMPEIIIPDIDLHPLIDLHKMTYTYDKKERNYTFKMSHILCEKWKDTMFTLSALYYYDPAIDFMNKDKLKEIVTAFCINRIRVQKLNGIHENSEYDTILAEINDDSFWEQPRYFKIGHVSSTIRSTFLIIDNIDAYLMEKGSGLQLLCTFLKIFFNKESKLDIKLKAATPELITNYYGPLGFECVGRNCTFNDVSRFLQEHCNSLSSGVKFILKFNSEYTTNIEDINPLFGK